MAVFRFSRLAERDLLGIAEYTLRTWGAGQAVIYLDELEACCRSLADHPALDRACDDIRPGLRRIEHGRHVVFYREKAGGILISRILHLRMLPDLNRIDDREDES
ncbi:MAG: type II toxin-antitoxin system RelE/ParE family toxin [Acidobacteriia bacterium]|nr:type II toxin-antitoxin system RelE/ParE family toxin [Terriglobia bacterium]MBZ5727142.1 type II toxin-antitoxin system RelE/ParE family toxin [Terriglobia bacterium]